MTAKTNAQIAADIASALASGGRGDITAEDLRTLLQNWLENTAAGTDQLTTAGRNLIKAANVAAQQDLLEISDLAADVAAVETTAAEVEATAEAVNEILAELMITPNTASKLLGGENGRAVDFVSNTSFLRGDVELMDELCMSDITFTRAGPAITYDQDGYSSQVSNNVEVRPSRRRGDGANRGIRISSWRPNILYSATDPTSDDWTKTRCSVTLDATKTAPDGSNDVWEMVKTSSAGFATYADTVAIKLTPDRDYVFTWHIYRDTDCSLLQMKPSLTGGSVLTGNVTVDLQNMTIVEEVNGTGKIELVNADWVRIEIRMHNTDNTRAAFSAVFDAGDSTATPTFYFSRPYVQEGPFFTGELPVTLQPRPATLTLALWQQLFPGAAAIGDFNGLNDLPNTDFTTGWTLSNVGRTVNTGAGYGGADAYTLADSSGAATGFCQYSLIKSLGATDRVYVGMIVYTAGVTSPFWEFRPQIYSTVTKLPRIRINNTVNKVSTITNDSTAVAQCIPVNDTTYLIVAEMTNAGGANVRHTFYPDIIASSGTGAIRVSHPFIRANATALWTKETVSSNYEFFEDVPFPGDALVEDTSAWDFTALAGTVAVDIDTMPLPDSNGDYDHYLFSLDNNSSSNRIEMYVRQNGDGEPELVGVWKQGSDSTTVYGTLGSLYAGRYAMAWDSQGAKVIRDDEVVGETSTVPRTVTGISKFRLGSNYAGALQGNTNFLRYFHRPRSMSADEINVAGRATIQVISSATAFTETQYAAFETALMSARTTLTGRTRSGLITFETAGLYIHLATGQSFSRGAWGNAPPLTTEAWLSGKGWADSLMFGGSVRDASTGNTVYDPITDGGAIAAEPRLLTGTTDNGDSVLTNAEIQSSGIPSTSWVGESPVVAASHEFKRLWCSSESVSSDSSRKILAGAIGSATDSTLAAISDVSGNPWLQQEDFINDVNTWGNSNSGVHGAPVGIIGTDMRHGEASYGGYVTQREYVDGGTAATGIGMAAMLDNINDLNNSVFGLSDVPLHIVSVPSMHWMNDGVAIGKAWRELEDTRDDVVIASASYIAQNSATAGAEHPTAWGSIVLGLHSARARHYVQTLGQNWVAPRIYKVWQKDDELIVGIIAMTYPLQYLLTGASYSSQPGAITNWGFRVTLDGIDVGIEQIEILSGYDGLIRIRMASRPERAVTVDYANKTGAAGRGNVYDSSPDFDYWDYRTITYPSYDSTRSLTGVSVAPGACGLLPDRITATLVS